MLRDEQSRLSGACRILDVAFGGVFIGAWFSVRRVVVGCLARACATPADIGGDDRAIIASVII